tara:strand:+ start:23 stop:202 length:180 start_codon:yes stop_codon:yes gene_type:complete
MSQLKSNTPAFIETNKYGTKRIKRNQSKEYQRKAVKGIVWERVPGSFSQTLKTSKKRRT